MQVPRKARAKAFAEEAIGASRIIDAFRGVDSEIDRVGAEIRAAAERPFAKLVGCPGMSGDVQAMSGRCLWDVRGCPGIPEDA